MIAGLRTVFILVVLLAGLCDSSAMNAEQEREVIENKPGYAANSVRNNSYITADTEIRLSEMEEKLRILNGKIEELEFQNKKLEERLGKALGDINFRFEELEKHHKSNMEASPITNEDKAKKENAKSSKDKNDGKPASMSGNKISPFTDSQKVDNFEQEQKESKSAKEQYDLAYELMKQKKYDDAELAFQQFINDFAGDPLEGNAYYWLGEVYYTKGDYKQASVNFMDGYKKYPQGSKAQDSLFKLAMSLGNLGQEKEACTTIAKLKSEFSKISPSIKARIDKQQKTWNCNK